MNDSYRHHLLRLVLLLILPGAGLLVYLSWHNKLQANIARDQAQQRYQELVRKQGDSETSSAAYRETLAAWQLWQNQSLFGTGGETLRQQQLQQGQHYLRLPGLFIEQLPLPPPERLSGPRWQAIPMRLRLQLLHEEDLLRYLAWLQRPEQPPVLLRRCSLVPAATGSLDSLLLADCELHWLRILLDKDKP